MDRNASPTRMVRLLFNFNSFIGFPLLFGAPAAACRGTVNGKDENRKLMLGNGLFSHTFSLKDRRRESNRERGKS